MNSEIALSVIVPIYNKEIYLSRCLESIKNSFVSYGNCEIILIDDGSTDKSGEIADQFALQYSDQLVIKVMHSDNHGVSYARNLGLDNARGNWITFVDADDTVIKESFCKALIDNQNSDSDILICGAIWGDSDSQKCDLREDVIVQWNEKPCFDFFLTGGAKGKRVQNTARKYMWGCKEKYYKKSFLQKNNIRFEESLQRNEDVLFSLQCYYTAKIIVFLPVNVYINYFDPFGITSSMDMEKNLYNFGRFLDLFQEKFIVADEAVMALFCFQHTLTFVKEGYIARENNKLNNKEYDQIMHKWFSRNDITKMLRNMPVNMLSKPKIVAFLFIKHRLYKLAGLEMHIYIQFKNRNL